MTNEYRSCSIDDCENKAITRGWCKKHYERWRAHGNPLECHRTPRDGVCPVDGCGGAIVARRLCRKHYSRWHKRGSVDRVTTDRGDVCLIDGCGKAVQARGWCTTHYNRWRLHGDPCRLPPLRKRAVCEVAGCGGFVAAYGLCNKHHKRQLKYGNFMATAWDDGCPTSLYRLYDGCGRLLYVGISIDIDRRFSNHSKTKQWWLDVEWHGIRMFPTRADAADAEREAIATELPLHNKVHARHADLTEG